MKINDKTWNPTVEKHVKADKSVNITRVINLPSMLKTIQKVDKMLNKLEEIMRKEKQVKHENNAQRHVCMVIYLHDIAFHSLNLSRHALFICVLQPIYNLCQEGM